MYTLNKNIQNDKNLFTLIFVLQVLPKAQSISLDNLQEFIDKL